MGYGYFTFAWLGKMTLIPFFTVGNKDTKRGHSLRDLQMDTTLISCTLTLQRRHPLDPCAWAKNRNRSHNIVKAH